MRISFILFYNVSYNTGLSLLFLYGMSSIFSASSFNRKTITWKYKNPHSAYIVGSIIKNDTDNLWHGSMTSNKDIEEPFTRR